MKRPLLKLFLLSSLVIAATGCGGGGGGGSADPGSETIAEGVQVEEVPPEDRGNGSLIPPSPVVVNPDLGGGSGSSWVIWPESLALNVLDENNVYANSDQALSWPSGGAGIYSVRADCSGFVTRSLMKAFGLTADDMVAWMGSKGPSSARYHDNILAGNNFQRIQKASDIRRGDIVAMKYIDKTSGGTGHTMIAARGAELRPAPTRPEIAGTVQYELRIIDSTSSPHGTPDTDTRKGTGANGSDQTGAGLGTMRLYADASSGVITGYTWSLSTGSTYYTATSPLDDRRSLVVGRMVFTQ